MKIYNYDYQTHFGIKLDTVKVLETTSQTVIKSENIDGIKEVTTALNGGPLKFPGHLGFKHYAKIFGEKICAKYPEIADATAKIREIKSQKLYISKDEIYKQVKPLINKLGKEVDIEL
jgi:hypothetical protein